MENLRWGVLLASLLAGPKLWSLVSAGALDSSTALLRWAAVVAACTLGVAGVRRIAAQYEAQSRADAARDAADAAERVVLEGTTLPAVPPTVTPPPPPVLRPPA